MNPEILAWLFFRILRWACWLGFLGFCVYFVSDRQPHLNSFGHLLPVTEAALFGFSLLAVFAGFFELMMRERAGIARPTLGRFMPPATGQTATSPDRR
jgi:hypothetical protein